MRHILPAAVFAAVFPVTAAAQETDDFFLGRLILAAGLSPAPEAALPRSVTVIEGDEIRERGINQAVEAIRSLPGVSANRAGGPGGMTNLRVRGTESRHVQVILDGVRMDDTDAGAFDFAGLQTADIERIEVIRGPQSVFFGSNTIGGVVSITTRQATEPGVSGTLGVEAGSDRTMGLDLRLGLRGERGGLTFSGILRNEGGYDVSDVLRLGGGQRDGMRNRTLNLSGDYQLTDDWRVGFLLRARNQHNESDPEVSFPLPPVTAVEDIAYDRNDFGRIRERMASAFAEGDLVDGRLRLTLRASRLERDRGFFENAVQSQDATSDRTELAMRGVWALDGGTVDTARHTLGFGLDHMDEGFVHNNPALVFDPSQLIRQSRSLTGLSLEYRGNLAEGLDVQAGLRRDVNDRFRDATTWSVGVSYALPGTGTRLRASAGTAVQNPTLLDQFGFIPGTFVGNPALRPERSRGWDIGIDQTIMDGAGQLSLTYFQNTIHDRIMPVFGVVTTVDNSAARSTRKGVELGFEGRIADQVTLRANYTYTDARGEAGERLTRRPRHEGALGVDWDATDLTRLSLDIRRVVGNLDQGFALVGMPTLRLPDYTLVNLSATHRLTDQVSLHARVNNLTNRRYQEVLGYAGQPRTFYVGLRRNF